MARRRKPSLARLKRFFGRKKIEPWERPALERYYHESDPLRHLTRRNGLISHGVAFGAGVYSQSADGKALIKKAMGTSVGLNPPRRRKGESRKRFEARKRRARTLNPTGYVFSGGVYRPGTKRGGPRYFRRLGSSWADVHERSAFYPGAGKPRRNPVLQIVGMPARYLTNPWLGTLGTSVMGGLGLGLGMHTAGALVKRNGGGRRRRRRAR